MVLLLCVVWTVVTLWCPVGGWSIPEGPRWLHSHAWHLGEDGPKADLTWALLPFHVVSESLSPWSLQQNHRTSYAVALGCKRWRGSCRTFKENLCSITFVAVCYSHQSEASPESIDPTSWWGRCQRTCSYREMLILLRVGVSTKWIEGTGLEESAPRIGWLAGLNAQGPLRTHSFQWQERAGWRDSDRPSVPAPRILPFHLLVFPSQLCLPSFINAIVAEVLIFKNS